MAPGTAPQVGADCHGSVTAFPVCGQREMWLVMATFGPSRTSVPMGQVLILTSVKDRIGRPLSQLAVLAF